MPSVHLAPLPPRKAKHRVSAILANPESRGGICAPFCVCGTEAQRGVRTCPRSLRVQGFLAFKMAFRRPRAAACHSTEPCQPSSLWKAFQPGLCAPFCPAVPPPPWLFLFNPAPSFAAQGAPSHPHPPHSHLSQSCGCKQSCLFIYILSMGFCAIMAAA